MTNAELAAKAAADSTARIKAADDEALLAAEAFAYGVFEKYYAARVKDIERRINDHFGPAGSGNPATWLADPTSPGEPPG